MLNVLKDYDQEFSSIMFITFIIINIIVNIIKYNFSTFHTNMQVLKLNIFHVQNVICHLYTIYKYLNVLHYMHIEIMNPSFIIIRLFIGIIDRIQNMSTMHLLTFINCTVITILFHDYKSNGAAENRYHFSHLTSTIR